MSNTFITIRQNFRGFKSLFDTPIQLENSIIEKLIVKIKNFRPFAQRFLLSFIKKLLNTPPIISLFKGCSPFAIIRSVISIVVDSFNRKSLFISLPHVFEKSLKIHPLITNLYSTFSIIFKRSIRFIKTSSLHVRPGFINRGVNHSVFSSSYKFFLIQTATAFRSSISDVVKITYLFCSARTVTKNHRKRGSVGSDSVSYSFENFKPSKFLFLDNFHIINLHRSSWCGKLVY